MRIVYNSFHGRYCDSPRAIYESLRGRRGLEHLWLLDPEHAAGFGDGVDCVDITSHGARKALEAADVVVANTHTGVEWGKPIGAFYLQTWHGTPLKRIHHDVLWAPEGRLARLDKDIEKWDLLLSPNPVSTPRLRRAFRFTGPIAETGYPRNDVLVDPDRAARRRSAIRELLELPADRFVVLYAPTWRDNEVFGSRPREDWGTELGEAAAQLPDVTFLVRAHNLVPPGTRLAGGAAVLDLSSYPDISDLCLAADVLVTDYSSVMFDFANTGKPLVFFPYDLDAFRDEIRGFYFDLFAEAPGPVVDTAAQLVTELRALATSSTAHDTGHGASYARFTETYCCLEDGSATRRVIELLEPHLSRET